MPDDISLLHHSLAIARRSQQNGNLHFGCLLTDAAGNILIEAENTVISSGSSIAHCEINLVQQLAGKYESAFLETCTVYASTEPCPMCAAAIFWSGIGRLVFALSKDAYHQLAGTSNPAHRMDMTAGEVLARGGRKVKTEGPLLEKEAIEFYRQLLKE